MNNPKNLVNKLVRKSFGLFWSGDWHPGTNLYRTVPWRSDELNCVGRRKYFSFDYCLMPPLDLPLLFFGAFIAPICKGAGRFLKKDGSKLRVKPEYISCAQKYAELYKRETGKEVEIFCLQ